MVDNTPPEIPPTASAPVTDPSDVGGEPDDRTVVRPRRKTAAEPAEPAVAVAPAEVAPAEPAAVAAPAPVASAAPEPYAAPMAPQPNYYATPVAQPPKGLAVASMALGIGGLILSFFGFGFLIVVAAVVIGHIASTRQRHATGFWLTGIITGYLGIAFSAIYGVIWLRFFIETPNALQVLFGI